MHSARSSVDKEARLPTRKQPEHGVHEQDNEPTIVFVTACTKDREPWLATECCHGTLRDIWRDATGWLVGRYVVMPDHVHFFASPGTMDISLEDWGKYWKSRFSKHLKRAECRWQRSHWDTRMRNPRLYEEKWDYVRHNPVRKGLTIAPDDWPYQGEIFELRW